MATHNQVRVVGYLRKDPTIINRDEEGAEKAVFLIRTMHRDLDGYEGMKFQDIMVYYDGTELMNRIKLLSQFDLIDIKGVFNIINLDKNSKCTACGALNTKKNGTSTFVYPISLIKLNGMRTAFEHDQALPERILEKHFKEVSNQVLIIGTVVSEPEMVQGTRSPCCRFRLGVDRKYYIKTQGDIHADYPWVYSYAQEAERDFRYLQQGSVILVDGFIQNRQVKSSIVCHNCGCTYQYPDAATEFVPYSIEYLSNYLTDEDIEYKENIEKNKIMNQIF
ncbi:single-stranded DNA-binding protein [Ruminococcus sp. CLA-AA-H200]|uniref:Single-stranded DNA-binding protein n=1 Tax=Ruminococcus turbiniformis TaxID=2881258 RepID=A0ABS8FX73_9FIRM|nr:single-stranded DNA-binding protein [Ruminococcus turbiniformis]MCC2254566.1 single-stranded DNA-binding protein [Ruminococcus turbiniformis]